MELGITEIIGIILALSMLAFGLVMIKQHHESAQMVAESHISSNTLQTLRTTLLNDLETENFVVSHDTLTVKGKETFLVGFKSDQEQEVFLAIKPLEAQTGNWFLYKQTGTTMRQGEKQVFPVVVEPEAAKGSYLFEVSIGSATQIQQKQLIITVE